MAKKSSQQRYLKYCSPGASRPGGFVLYLHNHEQVDIYKEGGSARVSWREEHGCPVLGRLESADLFDVRISITQTFFISSETTHSAIRSCGTSTPPPPLAFPGR